MLELVIPGTEWWDDRNEEFVSSKETKLVLEHSLVSISKWEAKWKKPFISKEGRSIEETLDYIRCMTISQNTDPKVYGLITAEQLKQVEDYINDPMTATWFKNDKNKPSSEQITSELIYFWMITAGVPIECQKWHLNRLLTLLKICAIKNQPSKKMPKSEIYKNNAALNAARRKRLGSKG